MKGSVNQNGDADGYAEDRNREECLGARREHLAREKELTRLTDERERLPAVEVEKEYVFEGPRPRMQRSKCMGKMRGG